MRIIETTQTRLVTEHRIGGAVVEATLLSLVFIGLAVVAWSKVAAVGILFVVIALANVGIMAARMGRETLELNRGTGEAVLTSGGPLRKTVAHRIPLEAVTAVRLETNPDKEERHWAARALLVTKGEERPVSRYYLPRAEAEALVAKIDAWLAAG
ncbi:MAG TPA: hypothetical protein ENK63_05640 [Rhodobacterales bacterium]|nr:hypothetical protein [Rhodobacterales bacterium]